MDNASATNLSFAVVVPMYNEGRSAEACVRAIVPALGEVAHRWGIIAVNDGSADDTGPILDRLAEEFPCLTVVHHARNGGYGAGLRTGVAKALELDYDYALFMDSDRTNPPEHIPRFIPFMEQGIDVIKASRFSGDGRMVGVPAKRLIMTRIARLIASALFRVGVSDCTNGFRAIKTAIFLKMPLGERGFPIIMEELYWAKKFGCTFANVPTVLYSRSPEQLPTRFAYNYHTLTHYLVHAVRAGMTRRHGRNSLNV